MTAPIAQETIDLAPEPDFSIGSLGVRPSSRSIAPQGGEQRTVEPRVMQVLVALWRRAGEVVSRDQLIAACWDGRIVGDDAINGCIAKVRRIGETHNAFTIETVPRVGYRLKASAQSSVAEHAPAAPAKQANPVRWALFAVLAVALAGGSWLVTELTRAPAAVAIADRLRVAVLPISTATDDPEARAFAASLAAEIAGVLSEYQLQPVSPSELAGLTTANRTGLLKRLGAAFTIEGAVQRDQGLLRARMRLDDVAEGITLWSTDFERPESQRLRLEAIIAARLASVAGAAIDTRRETNVPIDAATLGLHVTTGDRFFATDQRVLEDNLGLHKDIVSRAPDFAIGHADYAGALLAMAYPLDDEAFASLATLARSEAETALRLDPDCASAFSALIALTPATGWRERDALLKKAIALQAGASALTWLEGRHLTLAGLVDEGVRIERQAQDADRKGPAPAWWLGEALYVAGDASGAIAELDRILYVEPDHVNARRARFMIAALAAPPKDALAMLHDADRRPLDFDPQLVEAVEAYLKARATGAAADRQAAVRRIRALPFGRTPRGVDIQLLSTLGETVAAFDVAEAYFSDSRIMRSSRPFIPNFLFSPATAPMRHDPRFVALMDKLGLASYWRETGKWPDFCEAEAAICSALGKP